MPSVSSFPSTPSLKSCGPLSFPIDVNFMITRATIFHYLHIESPQGLDQTQSSIPARKMPRNNATLNRRGFRSIPTENLGGYAHGILVTERRRGPQALRVAVFVKIQEMESISHTATAPLRGQGILPGFDQGGLLERLSALIDIPINLAVLVFSTITSKFGHCKRKKIHSQLAHHASSSEHCVVHRVGLDVAAATHEVYLDNDQVVDMVEILPQDSL